MRRGIHITIALVAIILLARPFDCFANGRVTKKTMECCKKGKCAPKADADECCKGTLPNGNQFLAKPTDHIVPVADIAILPDSQPTSSLLFEPVFIVHSPPGSPPELRLNLPLLI
jgi:hypothetical protein